MFDTFDMIINSLLFILITYFLFDQNKRIRKLEKLNATDTNSSP